MHSSRLDFTRPKDTLHLANLFFLHPLHFYRLKLRGDISSFWKKHLETTALTNNTVTSVTLTVIASMKNSTKRPF